MDLPPLSSFFFPPSLFYFLFSSLFPSPPPCSPLSPSLPPLPHLSFWCLFLTYLHACAREDSLDVAKPTYAIAAAPWMRCVPTSVPGLFAQSL